MTTRRVSQYSIQYDLGEIRSRVDASKVKNRAKSPAEHNPHKGVSYPKGSKSQIKAKRIITYMYI